jgi:16S rRNA processing protein RimM
MCFSRFFYLCTLIIFSLFMLPIGKIKKTFGAHGELLLSMYDNRRAPQPSTPVWTSIDGLWVPLYVGRVEARGGKVVVLFDDVESEQQALELVGKELWLEPRIEASASVAKPKAGEAYAGYAFADKWHGAIGKFSHRLDFPGNPVLALIDEQGREILVPDNAALVVSIDKKAKTVMLNLPDGLLDLYL